MTVVTTACMVVLAISLVLVVVFVVRARGLVDRSLGLDTMMSVVLNGLAVVIVATGDVDVVDLGVGRRCTRAQFCAHHVGGRRRLLRAPQVGRACIQHVQRVGRVRRAQSCQLDSFQRVASTSRARPRRRARQHKRRT